MSVILNDYKEIESLFAQLGVKKPFICCGKSFQKTKIFDYLKQFNPVVFDNIRPNPRFDDMITAAQLFNAEGCDFMIGAGGGSPMDSAKMIRLMTTNDVSKCLDEPMENNDIKALFIPTTAGTGSEATKTSVFYLNDVEKTSIGNYDFIPDYIIFDEKLLETVSDYQRKCTCLDALCHAIESFWNTKANDESKEYASKAIKLFFENKDSYMKNEPAGNRGMLMASYYGGKAINLTGTTAGHAMCYNITMNCGTAHGHSVASGLSKIWEYMLNNFNEVNDSRGKEYVEETLSQLDNQMGGNALNTFNSLIDEFELAKPTANETQISIFASKVPAKKLLTNPVKLSQEDVEKIYSNILL